MNLHRICHAPRCWEYSRPPSAPAVIAPQYRPAPWEGWRIPQGSPASPWEGVSKFHYPPRCPRARPATAGSKACVDRSVRSLFTSSELPSWRRAFRRYHTGFVPGILCIQFSVGGVFPPHLSGGSEAKIAGGQRRFFKIFFIVSIPRLILSRTAFSDTFSALAISVLLLPRI